MNDKHIKNKISEIGREVFEDENFNAENDLVASQFEKWDSLNNIRFLVKIEAEFNFTFSTKEITGLSSLRPLIELVKQKI